MNASGKRLNKAIADKVKHILDGADNIQSVRIHIRGAFDEVTSIAYSIEELIVPSEEEEENNAEEKK